MKTSRIIGHAILIAFAVAVSVVFILLGVALSIGYAAEGVYVNGSLGANIVVGLPENGTWYQEGMPGDMDKVSLGYKAGLGYQWANWYVESNYVNFGSISNRGQFVGDHDYSTSLKSCIACDDISTGWIKGNMQGGEVLLGYRWNTQGLIQPKLHGGVFGATHTVSFADNYPSVGHSRQHSYSGMVLGATSGAGVCLKWVCADISYYKVISHTYYPFARGIVMPTLSVNVPLTLW